MAQLLFHCLWAGHRVGNFGPQHVAVALAQPTDGHTQFAFAQPQACAGCMLSIEGTCSGGMPYSSRGRSIVLTLLLRMAMAVPDP